MEMTFTKFEKAAFYAVEGRELEDECDNLLREVVETHEPVENYRPVDVMTGKAAGRVERTPYGDVVIRRNVQREKGRQRETMYLFREGDSTLIGWGA